MTVIKRCIASLCAGLMLAPMGFAPPARAQDDFGFEIVEDKVTDVDKQRIDDAKDLLGQERFGEAFAAFEQVLADPKQKKNHEAVRYEVCKGYYKMGAYHASLACFEKILDEGPKNSMYAQTREWLFFIARKVKDELAALTLIAKYAKPAEIPAEYQNELSFALGRYYFLVALDLGAKGVETEEKALGEDRRDDGGDNSGALDIENTGPAPKEEKSKGKDKGKGKKEEKPADDGGFDFSADDLGGGDMVFQGDGFDFDFGDAKPKDGGKKKPAPAKKPDKGKKPDPKEEKREEPPPPPPKPEKKEHAFLGPKDPDGALSLSLENLNRVKPEFERYAQALYIRGLVHYTRGEFEPAVKMFREVVRITNPRGGTVDNPKLREMAFFSLARIHYQFEQFRYAIFYYDRVSRDSEQWLESLFESSWAHFRLGEYEKALGNLVTLQSPFFQDEYYPEAAILKAITFYENCRYPEARAFLGEFEQNYGAVLKELKRLIGEDVEQAAEAATGGQKGKPADPRTAEQLFNELTELEERVRQGKDDASRTYAITARLLRLALSDKRVKGYREAIEEVDAEKAALDGLSGGYAGGALHTEAMKAIEKRRKELVTLAGTLLRDKLENEKLFLQDLTAKLLRIRFEITKGEKEADEASLAGQSQTVNLSGYQFLTAVDDERLYWPFEGEYWRDELGTYQYTLTKGCRPPADTTITGN